MNDHEAGQVKTLGRNQAITGRKMRDMASEVIRLNERLERAEGDRDRAQESARKDAEDALERMADLHIVSAELAALTSRLSRASGLLERWLDWDLITGKPAPFDETETFLSAGEREPKESPKKPLDTPRPGG